MPATAKADIWSSMVTDDCNWQQVGDPVQRRRIQNKISKRRQRDRLRQQKAKGKEVAAQNFDRIFQDSALRRNSSAVTGTPPTTLESNHTTRWRGHSSPPGAMSFPEYPARHDTLEAHHYASRPHDIFVPSYSTSFPSEHSSASCSSSGPPSYWMQTSSIPSLSSQFPPTPVTDHSRSPAPFKSPMLSRQTPSSEPVPQLPWPSMEIKEHTFTPENSVEARVRDCHLEAPTPTLPASSSSFLYSRLELPQSISETTDSSSHGRLNNFVTYSQAIGYPSFESSVMDCYNR